ncbi:MAG: hypothetical protein V3U11_04495 [Planctomycetota bacterium]
MRGLAFQQVLVIGLQDCPVVIRIKYRIAVSGLQDNPVPLRDEDGVPAAWGQHHNCVGHQEEPLAVVTQLKVNDVTVVA